MVQYHLLTATLFVLISTNLASCFVIPTGSFSFPTRSRHACGISKSILKPGRGSDDLSADTGVRTGARKLRHRLDAKKKKAGSAGRPSLDDVERLSRGQAAKKRGTGSRGVCHRLNESERKAYDLAKKLGYVVLRGTGYRRERKGSPLLNIYRQFCDAKAIACTSVSTGLGPDAVDEVEIDFSPLRVAREITDPLGERADSIAAELEGKLMVEDGADNMAIASPVEDVSTGEQRVVREEGEEGDGDDENDDGEDEEDEWLGDPNKRPIWKFPVVSRVYQCGTRKGAKDVAEALSSLR